MELETLLRQVDDYKPMLAGDFAASDAYWFGESIAEKVGWSPDLDLHKLITRIGGTIHYIDYALFRRYPLIFANSIYVRKVSDFDVILPAYAPMAENRLTLAHELGHYVLHAQKSGQSYACRNGDTPVEKQADCFALGFLMPSKQFQTAQTKYGIDDLALVFRVPDFAIQARLKSLDLSSDQ